ncbi:hypothetical protein, partial [Caulobacter sp. CCH9-E1]|uniref:hypothetical protein n=1 Tax=Caulobacter sp. CCH9-E1 TaxID=1768768 RepID=UPI0018D22BD0
TSACWTTTSTSRKPGSTGRKTTSGKSLFPSRRVITLAIALSLGSVGLADAQSAPELLAKVDPFVGVDGGGVTGGNTVPGAARRSASCR